MTEFGVRMAKSKSPKKEKKKPKKGAKKALPTTTGAAPAK